MNPILIGAILIILLTLAVTTLASLNYKLGRLVEIHAKLERHLANLAMINRAQFIEDNTIPMTANGEELLRGYKQN